MDEARLYTLRVWQHAGQWRAAVRAVGDDGAWLFTDPVPLAAWLRTAGARPADAGVGDGTRPAAAAPAASG
jgi:hypothetical protein